MSSQARSVNLEIPRMEKDSSILLEQKKFFENFVEKNLIKAGIFLDSTDEKKGKERLMQLFQENKIKKYDDQFLCLVRKSSSYPDAIAIIHYSMLQDPNYQADGEFVFDSVMNQDKVQIKKDDKGYYLEKKNAEKEMRFYDGESFVNYLENEFHEDLKKNFLVEKNKKINRYISSFDIDEEKTMKILKNGIWDQHDFNKEYPEFQEKIKCFLKSRKQKNNVISKLKEKGIVKKIIKNFANDPYFRSADHLMEQTQILLKKTNFGKRFVYEPKMTRSDAQKKAEETGGGIVLRELTSKKRRGFVITQSTPKGITHRVIIAISTEMKTLSEKTFCFRVEIEKKPEETMVIEESKEQNNWNYLDPRQFVEYISSRKDFLQCLVCSEFGTETVHVSKNLHCEDLHDAWCEDCATEYLWSKMGENDFVFRCYGCDKSIPLENVENFLLDESKKHPKKQQLMSKLSMEIYKAQLKNWGFEIFPCPSPDCNGTFAITKKTLEDISYADCLACKKRICLHCKEEFHHDFTCAQRQQWLKLNEEESRKTAEYKEKNVKQCPNCKIEIEKAYGCDHVTCTSCKFEFCFICGKQYKEGHLREHWVRNDPEAINGLLMQHLQLAQMGLLNNNPVSISQNVTSNQFRIPVRGTYPLLSQKPFIIFDEKNQIFVLDAVLAYMHRKNEMMEKSILELEQELKIEHQGDDDIDPETIDTNSVMQQNFN